MGCKPRLSSRLFILKTPNELPQDIRLGAPHPFAVVLNDVKFFLRQSKKYCLFHRFAFNMIYNHTMKARYQYRIYPTDQQRHDLARVFGCCRVVWNDALALCRQSDSLPSNSDLQKICITQAKKTEKRKWLSKVSNIPLQQSIADLGVAFKNFFASKAGARKGKAFGLPNFKKKDNEQTARFRKGGFSLKAAKVYLAKIGEIKTMWSRPLPSEPSSVTVIKDRAGRYFLSFVVDVEPEIVAAQTQSVGIDLGLKTFAVLSAGEKIDSPDYSMLERRIRRAQRKMSRRKKGSRRREFMRVKVAKLKAKQRDTRKDFLHKTSTRIVRENQTIVLEDLNVSGMVKNRKLSRAISQMGWREFRTMCEAKSTKFLREFIVISRWEPTSQICCDCGYRWGKLDLKIREVVCMGCGAHHCRDGNAAKNIERVGVGHTHDDKRTGSRNKTPVGATCDELSTQLLGEKLCLSF
jgi:putative transposase